MAVFLIYLAFLDLAAMLDTRICVVVDVCSLWDYDSITGSLLLGFPLLTWVNLKCIDTILTYSQNPQHPATLADKYLQITIMVMGIQNISHFRLNLQCFVFSITGAVSLPMFGRPLDLWLEDLWSH